MLFVSLSVVTGIRVRSIRCVLLTIVCILAFHCLFHFSSSLPGIVLLCELVV